MNRLKTIIVNVSRLILALTFIFSGYIKAIDPLGTQYKIQDYLGALGMREWVADWITLAASISLSGIEFCLGIFILFAIRRRLTSKSGKRLRMFRRCYRIDECGNTAQEYIAARLCGHCGDLAVAHGALHQPKQPMDCDQLYHSVHLGQQCL